ncbi:Inositol polyphosphate 5-phosphatase [Handroanthus impetiginosus]|uniref:Inositol polyphosphate 5-phosphatase n=1 Tax=Handroanthus impetiginosus TaxID=429701 RepID=A0A2G9I587_9LAMI|nr:Inositol polyphosphate 5-phosphatase [Handroanthus impetiginosus]
MRDENTKKSKLSWPKTLKKWFNLQSKSGDFHANDIIYEGVDEEWRNNFREGEGITIKKGKTGKSNRRNFDRNNIDLDASRVTDVHNYRIFVATWNVAGKSPPSYLNLEEWLHTSPPADIYVLGFQEIVPLNAGNVLGTEDNGPARKWQALIRKTLNRFPVGLDDDFERSSREKGSSFFHRHSFQSMSRSMRMMESGISMGQPRLDRRFSVCDRTIYGHEPSDYYYPDVRCNDSSDDEDGPSGSPYTNYSPISYTRSVSIEDIDRHPAHSRYCLVASKQMVGIFLTIWIKSDLRDAVHNLKVSCVGRGLMGYLGNKGSISISMFLHQTSFCFVCSHLTSGEKDGDELRRNSDVLEILRKTRFMGDENSPQTILDHDRIIWLGDLNYRIALAYRCAKALVEMQNWRALLENDQLRIEQRHRRVFAGWNEGNIYFPPTYKYSNNSDRYAGENMHPKEKRRTPAWCDRILWHGHGLRQLSYVRGESRFSDHRPVCSIFLAEVESINCSRIKKGTSNSSSRVEVEELLPYLHGYGQQNFF